MKKTRRLTKKTSRESFEKKQAKIFTVKKISGKNNNISVKFGLIVLVGGVLFLSLVSLFSMHVCVSNKSGVLKERKNRERENK